MEASCTLDAMMLVTFYTFQSHPKVSQFYSGSPFSPRSHLFLICNRPLKTLANKKKLKTLEFVTKLKTMYIPWLKGVVVVSPLSKSVGGSNQEVRVSNLLEMTFPGHWYPILIGSWKRRGRDHLLKQMSFKHSTILARKLQETIHTIGGININVQLYTVQYLIWHISKKN